MEFKSLFRDELAYLSALSDEFFADSPQLAKCFNYKEDKGIAQLFESAAFLNAALREKIDDHYPEFTQPFLASVWNAPLQPFPSTVIVQLSAVTRDEIHHIACGTEIKAENKVIFTLSRSVSLLPMKITSRLLHTTPEGGEITLAFSWFGKRNLLTQTMLKNAAVFLSPDEVIAKTLLLWFECYLQAVEIKIEQDWITLPLTTLASLPLNAENVLRPHDKSDYWSLQILQEGVLSPLSYLFIQLDLDFILAITQASGANNFLLRYRFNTPFPAHFSLDDNAFLFNCVPAINRFEQTVLIPASLSSSKLQTITVGTLQDEAYATKILTISEPQAENETKKCEKLTFLPIQQHTANQITDSILYYQEKWVMNVIGKTELQLCFFDKNKTPELLKLPCYATVSSVNCQNVIEPLKIGDINRFNQSTIKNVRVTNLTTPTPCYPTIAYNQSAWELISYLSLSPAFLAQRESVVGLVKTLLFYTAEDLSFTRKLDKQLSGILAATSQAINWLDGDTVTRGIELRLTIDSRCFSDESEHYFLFKLLSKTLPYCLDENNFLIMVATDVTTKQQWRFPAVKGRRAQI